MCAYFTGKGRGRERERERVLSARAVAEQCLRSFTELGDGGPDAGPGLGLEVCRVKNGFAAGPSPPGPAALSTATAEANGYRDLKV